MMQYAQNAVKRLKFLSSLQMTDQYIAKNALKQEDK